MPRTLPARPRSSHTSPRTSSVRPPMRSRPHVLPRRKERAREQGDSSAGGSATSSQRRFASSYSTTSGCGTTSAGRCSTATTQAAIQEQLPSAVSVPIAFDDSDRLSDALVACDLGAAQVLERAQHVIEVPGRERELEPALVDHLAGCPLVLEQASTTLIVVPNDDTVAPCSASQFQPPSGSSSPSKNPLSAHGVSLGAPPRYRTCSRTRPTARWNFVATRRRPSRSSRRTWLPRSGRIRCCPDRAGSRGDRRPACPRPPGPLCRPARRRDA